MNALRRAWWRLRRARHGERTPLAGGQYDAFEFYRFMQDFLQAHPDVIEDQQRGWDIYWNPGLERWQEHPVPDQREAAH